MSTPDFTPDTADGSSALPSSSSDGNSMVPRSPLDLAITQRLLRARIARGEITQADIDLLKRGYRWMTLSAVLGAATGVPVFYVLGRRRPPMGTARRLVAGLIAGGSGAFTGFTIGGAAAALEVNNHMVDSGRKMKVFQQVMIDSKRLSEQQRQGIPIDENLPAFSTVLRGNSSPNPNPNPAPAAGSARDAARSAPFKRTPPGATGGAWDADSGEEMMSERRAGARGTMGASEREVERAEMEREREREREGERRTMAGREDRVSGATQAVSNATGGPAAGSTGMSTWDRIRQGSAPASRAALPTSSPSDTLRTPSDPFADRTRASSVRDYEGVDAAERDAEKRAFEELLERERRAGQEGQGAEVTQGDVWR